MYVDAALFSSTAAEACPEARGGTADSMVEGCTDAWRSLATRAGTE
jgi:hypothetical protein